MTQMVHDDEIQARFRQNGSTCFKPIQSLVSRFFIADANKFLVLEISMSGVMHAYLPKWSDGPFRNLEAAETLGRRYVLCRVPYNRYPGAFAASCSAFEIGGLTNLLGCQYCDIVMFTRQNLPLGWFDTAVGLSLSNLDRTNTKHFFRLGCMSSGKSCSAAICSSSTSRDRIWSICVSAFIMAMI